MPLQLLSPLFLMVWYGMVELTSTMKQMGPNGKGVGHIEQRKASTEILAIFAPQSMLPCSLMTIMQDNLDKPVRECQTSPSFTTSRANGGSGSNNMCIQLSIPIVSAARPKYSTYNIFQKKLQPHHSLCRPISRTTWISLNQNVKPLWIFTAKNMTEMVSLTTGTLRCAKL